MRNKRTYYSHLLFTFKSTPRSNRWFIIESRYNARVYFSLLNLHYEKRPYRSMRDYDLNIQTLGSALIDRYSFAETSYYNLCTYNYI